MYVLYWPLKIMEKDLNQDKLIASSFLSPKELGNYLNLSKSSVYRLVENRLISVYKIRGNLRFSIEDVEKYLSKCLIKSFD